MLKVIGKENCSQCLLVKKLLTNKGINFNYIDLYSLSKEEQSNYIKEAQKNKIMQLPLIIENNDFINLQEFISRFK
ncbi:glutaredoxin domain-containing protein [Clostridium botulinum]|uniref:glutaredoxin domain-containing protein n=1 Tax=Clostridium botulinum TaxID=1491 RepID=UPI0007748388|nr:glutaredoxin domain-containing protein [Clostridium botulinum]APH21014.1 glutaredoxin family protein [Clostridium botulinum]APQ71108.1 glutaredoxin family protein [Clostridium botulinum]MBN3379254.1 glutaredoxin [Clostridium botulinum]